MQPHSLTPSPPSNLPMTLPYSFHQHKLFFIPVACCLDRFEHYVHAVLNKTSHIHIYSTYLYHMMRSAWTLDSIFLDIIHVSHIIFSSLVFFTFNHYNYNSDTTVTVTGLQQCFVFLAAAPTPQDNVCALICILRKILSQTVTCFYFCDTFP